MANFDPLWRQRLCYYPNQHIAHGFTSRLTGPLWPSWQCALCTCKQYWSRHGSSYWHLVAALWCAQARGWAPCPRGVPAAMAMAPNRDCYKARQYQPIAQPSVDPLRCSSKSSRKKNRKHTSGSQVSVRKHNKSTGHISVRMDRCSHS